jgi:hypothetical protein
MAKTYIKIDTEIMVEEISDKKFISLILNDLDESWTTGTMCSIDGKKCLVGAGAALLGANYPLVYRMLSDGEGSLAEIVEEKNEHFEKIAAKRIANLLDLVRLDREPKNGYEGFWVDLVTSFNDRKNNEEHYENTIRPALVAAYEKLLQEENSVTSKD